jgi:hypothetical protein
MLPASLHAISSSAMRAQFQTFSSNPVLFFRKLLLHLIEITVIEGFRSNIGATGIGPGENLSSLHHACPVVLQLIRLGW